MSILSVDNISPIGSGTSVTVNKSVTLESGNTNITGVCTATSFVGNLTGQVTSTDHISITADSKRFLAGASNDARMYHDGSHTYFDSLTGNLYLYNHASNQQIIFGTEGSTKWKITDDGHFIPHTDSTFDIGTSTVRVRNIYADNLYGSGANLTNLPVPTTITVADESTDTTCNVLFTTTTSGNLAPKTGTNLVFNSASGNLRAGSLFVGTGTNESKTQDGLILERNSGDGEVHISAGRSGGNYSGLQFYVAGASGVTKRHNIDYQSNFKWYAANGITERAKITSDGYSKFTSDGTYDGYSNAAQAHEFRQSLNKPTLWCSNSSSAQTWDIIRAESARTNNSAFQFIVCTSGNLTDDEFRVRGDGNVYADSSFNPNGADYAEYFEWTDGNSSNEDRRGMTVVLDGNKIKVSTSSDSTDNIIGVVSGNASVIGDSSWNKWSGKYQKDDYGTYLKDENGERKLNPSFDDTKTYVSREDRQEWDAIGMVGKLRIRKGQKTGTRWIKMRDISATVEEWLVR